jgi:hypothetical protein
VATKKYLRNIIIKIAMRGDRSMPIPRRGRNLCIRHKTGSVSRARPWAIVWPKGLLENGITQEIMALAIMSHMYRVRAMSRIVAIAKRKLATTNIASS